jgi:hypothetical protein
MTRPTVLSVIVLVLVSGVAGVNLHADQSSQPSDRLRIALQDSPRLTIPAWTLPPAKRLGVISIPPPQTRGEVVRMTLPIGDLTMRAARVIGNASHHRADRKARTEVQRAMSDFHAKR